MSDIIRETTANNSVVTTERLSTPYLCRPYRSAVVDNSGHESCVGYFTSQGAANQWHDMCVKNLMEGALLK